MNNLTKQLNITTTKVIAHLPEIIDESTASGRRQLQDLIKNNQLIIRDIFADQINELCNIRNPKIDINSAIFIKKYQQLVEETSSRWVHFPWRKQLVHMLTEKELNELRTNRNRNLLTTAEQKKLEKFTVGVIGLSIGNSMAATLAYGGVSQTMKLAELDTLETSNLNRIRASVADIGQPKINITAQHIYEINPYAKLHLFSKGLTDPTLDKFITGSPKPKIILEAIDDLKMKMKIRLAARAAGIPVIMITNLGDRLLIDVERYDLDDTTPLFNGLIGETPEEILDQPISDADINKYVIKIVDPSNVPERAMSSVKSIGDTLVGRPQLMSTVTIGGAVASYLARRIALGHSVPSGRRLVKFNEVWIPTNN